MIIETVDAGRRECSFLLEKVVSIRESSNSEEWWISLNHGDDILVTKAIAEKVLKLWHSTHRVVMPVRT